MKNIMNLMTPKNFYRAWKVNLKKRGLKRRRNKRQYQQMLRSINNQIKKKDIRNLMDNMNRFNSKMNNYQKKK